MLLRVGALGPVRGRRVSQQETGGREMVHHYYIIYIQVKARARRTPSNLFLIFRDRKWPTGVTREEIQRHENLKNTLIFDCMIVIGAEFYVPNGA